MVNARIADRRIDRLYVEAMLLADEARGYFDGAGRDERDALPAAVRVDFACESLRATTRLMHVVAWLLTRRAVACGEISDTQGTAAARRLGSPQTSDPKVLARLPGEARRLCAATIDLFASVARLDRALEPAREASHPVGQLWRKLEGAF